MKFSLASFHQMSDRFIQVQNLTPYVNYTHELAKMCKLEFKTTPEGTLKIKSKHPTIPDSELTFTISQVKRGIRLRQSIIHSGHKEDEEYDDIIHHNQHELRANRIFQYFNRLVQFQK